MTNKQCGEEAAGSATEVVDLLPPSTSSSPSSPSQTSSASPHSTKPARDIHAGGIWGSCEPSIWIISASQTTELASRLLLEQLAVRWREVKTERQRGATGSPVTPLLLPDPGTKLLEYLPSTNRLKHFAPQFLNTHSFLPSLCAYLSKLISLGQVQKSELSV